MNELDQLRKEHERASGRKSDGSENVYKTEVADPIAEMNYRILRGILYFVGAVVAGLAIAYSVWYLFN